jgi:hypothetical protein
MMTNKCPSEVSALGHKSRTYISFPLDNTYLRYVRSGIVRLPWAPPGRGINFLQLCHFRNRDGSTFRPLLRNRFKKVRFCFEKG